MSSSDELSSNRQKHPHRTCHTDSEASTKPNKPVTGKKSSVLQTKKNTVPQDPNLTTTGKKEDKVPSTNQSALPLRKSTRQVTNINGLVSKKSLEPELVVPKKNTTPKCPSKTLLKERKKKNVELFEKKAACNAKLDEVDNSCPEQHLSSQKTKRTHYRNSKQTQNHQGPSDVSTGIHTCTTLSPRRHNEASSCHTNKPHILKQEGLQSGFLSSPVNSDLEPLEKRPPVDDTPSTPLRPRGRLKGRKNKKAKEGLSASPPVKRSRNCAVFPDESHTSKWDGDLSTPNSVSKTLSPKLAENNNASQSQPDVRKSSLEKRPPADGAPLTPGRPRGTLKGCKNKKGQKGPNASPTVKCSSKRVVLPDKPYSKQDGLSSSTQSDHQIVKKSRLEKRPLSDASLSTPKKPRGRPKGSKNSPVKPSKKCAAYTVQYHTPEQGKLHSNNLLSSTPNPDLQPLSPKTAENSQWDVRQEKLRSPADASPLTPRRPRGRPKGSKNLPVKPNKKSAAYSVECPTPEGGQLHSNNLLNSTPNSDLQPLSPKTAENSQCDGRLEKKPRGRPKGSKNSPVKPSQKCAAYAIEYHTPEWGKLQSNNLLSSTPNSDLQPLSPKTAENSQWDVRLQKHSADASPSTPQRPRGRPKGSKNKKVHEESSASPPVKRSRKNVVPSQEEQIPRSPFSENQEEEPKKFDQTMSSDLSIELSLQEDPLNHSVFMQDVEDDQDDDDDEEELPSFLGQDSKKPSSISEGLFVWCKLRKYPYWPAVVKSVNRKCKKASIVFIDCDLSDQKRAKKGFTVSLRTLKPIGCEDNEKLMQMANERYGSAITWSLELISDYRIRIGCGSFSGTFIEYCAADISCPVRKKYSEGKSVLTFPSQEILGVQCEIPEGNTEDFVEDQDELLSKKVLPDRTKAARTRANQQLVDFIIRGKVENHLLAIISASSDWIQALQKPFRAMVCPLVYLEDEEQVDKVFHYLKKLCETAPQINACLENVQVDQIRLILDVLLPKAIIYAIAGVYNLSLEKAKEKYHKGPRFSNRERQEFDMRIEEQMKLKEITPRHRQ